jgi:hypothetical protein
MKTNIKKIHEKLLTYLSFLVSDRTIQTLLNLLRQTILIGHDKFTSSCEYALI